MVNDFDPTTNRIPFGLLEDDERETLKAWPHGFQIYSGEWRDINPSWSSAVVYRGKPAPVVKTKWITVYDDVSLGYSYLSKESALDRAENTEGIIGVLRFDFCNGVPTFTFEPVGKGK